MVVVVRKHAHAEKLEVAVLEAEICTLSIERLLDGSQEGERPGSINGQVQFVRTVVVEPANTNRGMVAWPRRPRSLNCIPALRVTFQIEFLGNANIDIFGVSRKECGPQSVSRIGPVVNGHGPGEIIVVGISSKFNSSLRCSQNKWVPRG